MNDGKSRLPGRHSRPGKGAGLSRRGRRLAAGIGLTTSVCLTAAAFPARAGAHGGSEPLIVGFGDSVPSAARCACPGMLDYYADLLGNALGTTVAVDNESRSGATGASVLRQMSGARVARAVRAADAVVIMVGANDFSAAFAAVSHGASADRRYAPIAARLRSDLTRTIQDVHALHSGVRVLVCGYWNDFKDGKVAKRVYSKAQRDAAVSATTYTNNAIKAAVRAAGGIYVSTYVPFYDYENLDALLAADGDHPSAAGHRLIARTLFDAFPMDAR